MPAIQAKDCIPFLEPYSSEAENLFTNTLSLDTIVLFGPYLITIRDPSSPAREPEPV
jgi:hypothetical protein